MLFADGARRSFAYDLRQAETGKLTRLLPGHEALDAELTRADDAIDLSKVDRVQVQGDWSGRGIDLSLDHIVLLPPTPAMVQARAAVLRRPRLYRLLHTVKLLRVLLFAGCLAPAGCLSASSETAATAPATPQPALTSPPEAELLWLRTDELELGVLAGRGGRIVVLRVPGGPNLIHTDSARWTLRQPLVDPTRWPAMDGQLLGNVFWPAPQSAWWQFDEATRVPRQMGWPPDPFLTLAPYDILEHSPTRVLLRGPASPVTGLRLEMTIAVEGNRVVLEGAARNTRDTPMRWGLWSLTRVPHTAQAYVPVHENVELWFTPSPFKDPHNERPLPYRITNGFFHFTPPAEPETGMSWRNKAVFQPPRNRREEPLQLEMAAFIGETLLLKTAKLPEGDLTHKEHGPIELIKRWTHPQFGLLELEFHGPCRLLQPGQAATLSETWTILPYAGEASAQAQTAYLRDALGITRGMLRDRP